MQDVVDGIRRGGNPSQFLQFPVQPVKIIRRRTGTKPFKDLFRTASQPRIDFQDVRHFTLLPFPPVFGGIHGTEPVIQLIIFCQPVMVPDVFRNIPVIHQGAIEAVYDFPACIFI